MKTVLILLAVLLATATIATATIRVMDTQDLSGSAEHVRAGVRTLCIDGHKFVYAYGWGAERTQRGVGAGGGVSILQVYEDRNGRVVPATCRNR